MSKHTPGPWKANENPYPNGLIGVGQINNIFDIAKVSGRENADLIAAAPELLGALKQATNQLDRDYKFTPLDGSAALILKLRAAIAKAEGH